MKILITGGTGFVGSELGKLLVESGHEIFVTTRNAKRAELQVVYPAKFIEVDLSQSILSKDLWPQVDVVINLMGENVGAGRWTKDRREKIIRSRETALKNLTEYMPKSVKQFISASAIGYYGSQGDEILTESSPAPDSPDFLAQVCKKWEQQILELEKANPSINFVTLRIGMVLGSFGGALTKMLAIFRKHLGAELGSGNQWMSWIHLADLVAMITFLCGNESVKGIVNAVAPEPVTNAEFTRELTTQLKVFKAPRVPIFVLKIVLGEMSQLILNSQRVSAHKIMQAGFMFRYPTIALALEECLRPHI